MHKLWKTINEAVASDFHYEVTVGESCFLLIGMTVLSIIYTMREPTNTTNMLVALVLFHIAFIDYKYEEIPYVGVALLAICFIPTWQREPLLRLGVACISVGISVLLERFHIMGHGDIGLVGILTAGIYPYVMNFLYWFAIVSFCIAVIYKVMGKKTFPLAIPICIVYLCL